MIWLEIIGEFLLYFKRGGMVRNVSRPVIPKPMKSILSFSFALLVLLQLPLCAEDVKITGEAVCAKCELQQVSSCQMAIKVKTGGKEEIIMADNNKVAKDFHDEICQQNVRVKAEGVITIKDGKKTIALTKIEKAD
jgi:hypothetical protein